MAIENLQNYNITRLSCTIIYKLENQTLSSLRDWLLPMLMNGQVRVVDLEEEVISMVAEERGELGE